MTETPPDSADKPAGKSVDEQIFLIRTEASALCRVGVRTIDEWIASGKLPAIRAGRRVLIERSDLIQKMQSMKTTVPTQKDGDER